MSENHRFRGRGQVIDRGEPWDRVPLPEPVQPYIPQHYMNMQPAMPGWETNWSGHPQNGIYTTHGGGDSRAYQMTQPPPPQANPPYLRADAAEFTPRSYIGNPYAQPPQFPAQIAPQSKRVHQLGSTRDPVVDHLSSAIYDLTTNPGCYDDVVEELCELLNGLVDSNEALNQVVETIFEQGVKEFNFRYNGAKLCSYLSENLKLAPSLTPFRSAFLNRCKHELGKQNELEDTRLQGFVLLMAELFVNFEITKESKRTKMLPLALALIDLLNLLLSKTDKESIRCFMMSLKLCGGDLDDFLKETNQKDGPMDALFETIKAKTGLPSGAQAMLECIEKLRANNWGRTASSPDDSQLSSASSSAAAASYASWHNEGVFYSPDGQPIDENQFLDGHGQPEYCVDNISNELAENAMMQNEMDDEMALAYEQFLAEMEQKKLEQAKGT